VRRSALILIALPALAQTWAMQNSGTTASLRGLSAASPAVVWASGTGGTFLRTTDGGATWRAAVVPGAEALDFRDVQAVDSSTAYLLSIGPGAKSTIRKTTDAGAHWMLEYTEPDPAGFLDAFAFWNARHGIAVGDPVNGHFTILTTSDGGATWHRRSGPASLPEEGAFAASGTCITVRGRREAWFATGGPHAARVFHSTDGGRTWSVALTPVRNESASQGIFSLAFVGPVGIAVGGDYAKPDEAAHAIAITHDAGRSWSAPAAPLGGFRSAVAFVPDRRVWIAVGTSGSDVSTAGARSWRTFDRGNFNALAVISSRAAWAAGPKGRSARLQWK
jgi:photosystem II stability/assembly factor-like uncharacterized protein